MASCDNETEQQESKGEEIRSPPRKKRRGNNKRSTQGKASHSKLGNGVVPIDVPGSVARNAYFCTCYAHEEEGWVEVVLVFPASFQKLLMLDAAERAADATAIRSTKGVQRAVVVQDALLDGEVPT